MKHEENQVRIRISQLSPGTHSFHYSVNPQDIGLDETFHNHVVVDVNLEKTTRQMYVRGEVVATGRFTCDRCLEDFSQNIQSTFAVFYVFSEEEAAKFDAEEVRVIHPDTPTIDATDDVRQSVVLAVPLKLLCRDECKGLCATCGVNLNSETCSCREVMADSRWEGLKNILRNESRGRIE